MISETWKGRLQIAGAIALSILFGAVVVTCAVSENPTATLAHLFSPTPAPTPLPARPIGGVTRMPSVGEPPVSMPSDEQRAEWDSLPVGRDAAPAPIESAWAPGSASAAAADDGTS
ncbi:hypothetical protein K8I61_11735 [bacterium]|nr:hypothetical protein [bacterium]